MAAAEAAKVRLDLPLLLPDAPDEADACAARLVAELEGRAGVGRAHVVPAADGHPAQLCIHYDPGRLSLARVRELASAAGARLTERFGHLLWAADGLPNQRRARTVAEALLREPGVIEAGASASGVIRVEFDRALTSQQALREALDRLHVTPRPRDEHRGPTPEAHARPHDHDHGGFLGGKSELVFALASGALLAAGFLLAVATAAPGWVSLGLYAAAYGFGGFHPLREAIASLRLGRFEIDTLMLAAAAGAAALGEWAEGALLLFLFSLGHALEHHAMGRARRAIEDLAELAPPTAELRRDGEIREVPVADLAVGDVVLVRPNTRIPADGFVLRGTSAVDQAPVTGESLPADKRAVDDPERAASRPDSLAAEHRVYAGTINGAGPLDIQVTRRAGDTTLARVVRMVEEAEAQKSPTQRLTDRFERVFVPAVLVVVVLLLFAWALVDEPFADSFYRAMAVLVAASPCALAISTPSAVLAGIARAARGGALVKGGGPLESLGRLTAIVFDKTGTLTEGRPRVTDVVPAPGATEHALVTTAIALEALSDHPLAAAVVRDGRLRLGGAADAPEASEMRSIAGRGLVARLGGEPAAVGKAALFDGVGTPALPEAVRATVAELEARGRTTMVVSLGDQHLGVLGLMDTSRPGAGRVVARLRDLGIRRMVLLSGDNGRVAAAVADQLGLDEARGDLLPEDKAEAVRVLREAGVVAMVGDGVNDAPAMAHATVGVAMGAAGSDVALETADVALMGDDLARLPFAIGLSREAGRVIRQNLWVSLGSVAVLVPAALLGLPLGAAVLFHEGSTVLVVLNALRLLGYAEPEERPATS